MSTNPADEIRALMQTWDDALRQKNRAVLESVLADDFSIIGSSGRKLDKQKYLAFACGGTTQINPQPGTLDVRVYGDTAVAHGRSNVSGSFKSATYSAQNEIYTNSFARVGGRWVAVASHSTFEPTTSSSTKP